MAYCLYHLCTNLIVSLPSFFNGSDFEHVISRVVSSPLGINFFLGLSTFFKVIQRALKSCATLITRACA